MREGNPPESQRCRTCCWWDLFHTQQGLCRKNPPTFREIPLADPLISFPVTNWDDWCGQWASTRGWVSPQEE